MKRISNNIIGLFIVSLLFLSGCGGGDGDGDGDVTLNMPMPKDLAVVTESATAVLDPGGYSTDLTISGDTVSGTISSVPPGTYTLTITYTDTDTATTLATVTKANISVSAGGTTPVAILESDLFTDIDSDHDGFSNLAEVRIGTDPNINADAPAGGSPAFSAGGGSFINVSSASYSITAIIGESVAGNYDTFTNNSTAYVISAGFKGLN